MTIHETLSLVLAWMGGVLIGAIFFGAFSATFNVRGAESTAIHATPIARTGARVWADESGR